MEPQTDSIGTVRFGAFAVDLRAGKLLKNGRRIRLSEQPLRVLEMLLQHAGEVVTRDELHQRLWPADTFVEFDHGLNNVINRLREVLNDSADKPQYIETIPRRGYRFICPVGSVPLESPAPTAWWRRRWVTGLLALAALLAIALAVNVGGLRHRLLGTAPAVTSLAVLPLENLMGDPEQEYFVDGLHDELITQLAQVSSLKVIARGSVIDYKQKKEPLPAFARKLGVEAFLEGSVRRSGNRVRVTVQLIHAPSQRHLWAQTYEREEQDILILQSEVARAIVREVHVQLTPQEQTRLMRAHEIDPQVHRLYLLGRHHLSKRTKNGMLKAVEYFDQAIAKDPLYALAYSGLADSYNLLAGFGWLSPREAYPKAKEAAQRAVSLDDGLAEGYVSLADITASYEWNFTEGERLFRRAIALNPGDPTAHFWYARILVCQGKFDQAFLEVKRAQELDPLSPVIAENVGVIFFWARRYDEALEELLRARDLNPDYWRVHFTLGRVYEAQGRMDDAFASYQRGHALSGAGPETAAALTDAYRRSGMRGYWQERLDLEKKHWAKRQYFSPMNKALFYALAGENENALALLEEAYEERSDGLIYLAVMPPLDPLRSEARFQDLLRRMNLPRINATRVPRPVR